MITSTNIEITALLLIIAVYVTISHKRSKQFFSWHYTFLNAEAAITIGRYIFQLTNVPVQIYMNSFRIRHAQPITECKLLTNAFTSPKSKSG